MDSKLIIKCFFVLCLQFRCGFFLHKLCTHCFNFFAAVLLFSFKELAKQKLGKEELPEKYLEYGIKYRKNIFLRIEFFWSLT